MATNYQYARNLRMLTSVLSAFSFSLMSSRGPARLSNLADTSATRGGEFNPADSSRPK